MFLELLNIKRSLHKIEIKFLLYFYILFIRRTDIRLEIAFTDDDNLLEVWCLIQFSLAKVWKGNLSCSRERTRVTLQNNLKIFCLIRIDIFSLLFTQLLNSKLIRPGIISLWNLKSESIYNLIVNFTNILQAAFAQIFFCQKITKPNFT